MVERKGSGSDPLQCRLEANGTTYTFTLKNCSIICGHTIVAGKMSKHVSIVKILTLFSEPAIRYRSSKDFSHRKPPTHPHGSKVLLLLLFLTGLADNFLSCLFSSRRFEFWLDEKFNGCCLPFGIHPCLHLSPILPVPLFQYGDLLCCPQESRGSVDTHIPLLVQGTWSLAASCAHFHGDLTNLLYY